MPLTKVTSSLINTISATQIQTVAADAGKVLTSNGSTLGWTASSSFGGSGSLPTGTIIDFAGTSAPTGFLVCPTSTTNISRTTYADLFAVIGTTYGSGNGSTTFGLPTFTADFAKIQANSNVGTATTGSVIAHSHTYTGPSGSALNGPDTNACFFGGFTDTPTGSTGGTNNIAAGRRMLFCIKF
jgi:microcystin-dependent protein